MTLSVPGRENARFYADCPTGRMTPPKYAATRAIGGDQTDRPIRTLHVDDQPAFADLTAEFLERERRDLVVETETDPRAAIDRVVDGESTASSRTTRCPRWTGWNSSRSSATGAARPPSSSTRGRGRSRSPAGLSLSGSPTTSGRTPGPTVRGPRKPDRRGGLPALRRDRPGAQRAPLPRTRRRGPGAGVALRRGRRRRLREPRVRRLPGVLGSGGAGRSRRPRVHPPRRPLRDRRPADNPGGRRVAPDDRTHPRHRRRESQAGVGRLRPGVPPWAGGRPDRPARPDRCRRPQLLPPGADRQPPRGGLPVFERPRLADDDPGGGLRVADGLSERADPDRRPLVERRRPPGGARSDLADRSGGGRRRRALRGDLPDRHRRRRAPVGLAAGSRRRRRSPGRRTQGVHHRRHRPEAPRAEARAPERALRRLRERALPRPREPAPGAPRPRPDRPRDGGTRPPRRRARHRRRPRRPHRRPRGGDARRGHRRRPPNPSTSTQRRGRPGRRPRPATPT